MPRFTTYKYGFNLLKTIYKIFEFINAIVFLLNTSLGTLRKGTDRGRANSVAAVPSPCPKKNMIHERRRYMILVQILQN